LFFRLIDDTRKFYLAVIQGVKNLSVSLEQKNAVIAGLQLVRNRPLKEKPIGLDDPFQLKDFRLRR
jgi:hypothetical protein